MVFPANKNVIRDVDGFIGVPDPVLAPHAVNKAYLDAYLTVTDTATVDLTLTPGPLGTQLSAEAISVKSQIPAYFSDLNLAPYLVDGEWDIDTVGLSNTLANLPVPPYPATAQNYALNPKAVSYRSVMSVTNSPTYWTVNRGVTVSATPLGTTTADQIVPIGSPLGSGQIASTYNVDGWANSAAFARQIYAYVTTNVASEYRLRGNTVPAWTPMPANVWTRITAIIPASEHSILEFRPAGGAAVAAGSSAYVTDVSSSPGPGYMRYGGTGHLSVQNTGTRVIQRFELLVWNGNGIARVINYSRHKTASSGWGPWVMENGQIPLVGGVGEFQALARDTYTKAGATQWSSLLQARWLTEVNPNTYWTADGGVTLHSDYTTLAVGSGIWGNIGLNSPWVYYNGAAGGFTPANYLRTMEGIVMLRGLIKNGVVGSVIGTLPVGYRPAFKRMFYVWCAAPGESSARIDIATNGDITLVSYTGSANANTVAFIDLNDIVFPCLDAAPPGAWTQVTFAGGFLDYGTAGDPGWGPASYWVDPLGRVWFSGLIRHPATPAGGTAFTWDAAYAVGANNRDICASVSNTATTAVWQYEFVGNACSFRQGAAVFAAMPQQPVLGATQFPPAVWAGVGLTAPWVNYGGVYSTMGLTRASDGIIHGRGLIASGTSGTQIAPISQGYRGSPTWQDVWSSLASDLPARNDRGVSGEIIARVGTNSWRSMYGMSYLWEG